MTKYNISIVSDTVCPWCYVGKNRLELAMKQHLSTHPSDTFTTSWKPFYLNPDSPKVSTDKQALYEAKFGAQRTHVMVSSVAASAKFVAYSLTNKFVQQAHLARLGKDIGINFKYGGKTGNTRDSHRLIQLGKTKGEDVQTRVVEELFNAYFENEEDITEKETLVKRGVQAGLEEQEVREWLESGAGGEEVDREVMEAKKKFVTGVPNFTINGRFEIQGAEEPAAFLRVFDEVKDTEGSGNTGKRVEGDGFQNAC
jgi:predicted DsbA family dithiol-disulfide isomerase